MTGKSPKQSRYELILDQFFKWGCEAYFTKKDFEVHTEKELITGTTGGIPTMERRSPYRAQAPTTHRSDRRSQGLGCRRSPLRSLRLV